MPLEYLQRFRQKFPQYAEVPDQELARRIIAKFPEYRDRLGDVAGGSGSQPIFSGGPLSNVFDALSIPQYAAAGVVTGKGVTRGVQERTSFGELLSPQFRQTIPGRVSEFALNVAGDPLTYVPVGGLVSRGLRAVPGGARAIEAAQGPVRALAERAGLAIPETVRASRAVEGLVETKLQPLREAMQGARSETVLARIDAAKFSREFQQDALDLAGGNRRLAQEYRELVSRYFDDPAQHIVKNVRAFEDAARTTRAGGVSREVAGHLQMAQQDTFNVVRQQALQIRDRFLATLPADVSSFVERWGARAAREHEADLQRLVDLKFLTPARAGLWKDLYLRNAYLRHVDPEKYAEIIASTDPRKAAEVLAGVERAPAGRTAGGVPSAAQIRPRQALEASTQDQLGLIRNLDERYALQRELNASLIARGELNQQVSRLYAIPEDQVARLSQQVPGFERLFRPMPQDARWGQLAGRWVPKEVHDILEATAWKPEGALATFTKLIAAWKTGKVAMSPGTIRRNVTSNFSLIQSRLGTPALADALKEVPAAFNDVRTASDLYVRAVKAHPGFGSSALDAEVRDLLQAAGTSGTPQGIVDKIVGAVQAIGRPFTTAYEFSELTSKMAVFRSGVKHGLSDKAAATRAIVTLFDYGDVPPAILAMRRYGLWPFVTFPYKVVTQALPAVLEHPGRLAQQVKAIRAFTVSPTTEEQRALPPSLRSGGFVKLPFTDAKGRPVFYDMTYELFFGDVGEPGTPIGQAVAMLQGNASPAEAIPTFLTPVGQVAAEIAANRSFFTGQPIARPEEPEFLAKARHVARAALPGPAFALAETAATPLLRGAGLKPSSALARAAYEVPTARGVAPQSLPAAAAQTFAGMRTVPLDVGRETQANAAAVRGKLAEFDQRIRAIRRDQALSDAEKQRAIARLSEMKRQMLEKFGTTGAP